MVYHVLYRDVGELCDGEANRFKVFIANDHDMDDDIF